MAEECRLDCSGLFAYLFVFKTDVYHVCVVVIVSVFYLRLDTIQSTRNTHQD